MTVQSIQKQVNPAQIQRWPYTRCLEPALRPKRCIVMWLTTTSIVSGKGHSGTPVLPVRRSRQCDVTSVHINFDHEMVHVTVTITNRLLNIAAVEHIGWTICFGPTVTCVSVWVHFCPLAIGLPPVHHVSKCTSSTLCRSIPPTPPPHTHLSSFSDC